MSALRKIFLPFSLLPEAFPVEAFLTVLALLACALVSSVAQDAQKMDVVIERKQQKTVVQQGQTGKATELELKKRLEFEGVLAELGKTNGAVKIFNFNEPIDEKKAKEQVTK